MPEIYFVQSPISFFHLLLIAWFTWQRRKQNDVNYVTLFPWILVIIYGFVVYGAVAFGIILLSRLLYQYKDVQVRVTMTRGVSYVLIVGVEFLIWYSLNKQGVSWGALDIPYFYMVSFFILLILIVMMTYPSIKSKKSKHTHNIFVFVQEFIISLFLCLLIATSLWGMLWNSLFFYLPPLIIFGGITVLYIYGGKKTSPDNHPALYNRSVKTFLLLSLAIFVPIIGTLLALYLVNRDIPNTSING